LVFEKNKKKGGLFLALSSKGGPEGFFGGFLFFFGTEFLLGYLGKKRKKTRGDKKKKKKRLWGYGKNPGPEALPFPKKRGGFGPAKGGGGGGQGIILGPGGQGILLRGGIMGFGFEGFVWGVGAVLKRFNNKKRGFFLKKKIVC